MKLFSQNSNLLWSWYLNVTDRQTEGETTCLGNTALRIASRGKNYKKTWKSDSTTTTTTTTFVVLWDSFTGLKAIYRPAGQHWASSSEWVSEQFLNCTSAPCINNFGKAVRPSMHPVSRWVMTVHRAANWQNAWRVTSLTVSQVHSLVWIWRLCQAPDDRIHQLLNNTCACAIHFHITSAIFDGIQKPLSGIIELARSHNDENPARKTVSYFYFKLSVSHMGLSCLKHDLIW